MARLVAMYLPQYHPIPENDEWWGKGYTEWTAVARARPQFLGHHQPHLPSELGYYDLRVPETREAQAALAKDHGIHGFCYYHYWFNGRLVLERPLREVLESGKPDLPFCMCWANENWTRSWSGGDDQVLLEQKYSEEDDYKHIRWLIPYFSDRRYIRVQGKPVFIVYRASKIPRLREMARVWREELARVGIPGLYLIRVESSHVGEAGDPTDVGADAAFRFQPLWEDAGPVKLQWMRRRAIRRLIPKKYTKNWIRDYDRLVKGALARKPSSYKVYPSVMPGWDNTARRAPANPAAIWVNSTPKSYEHWLRETLRTFREFGPDEDFVFINAWNEWGEGDHLEPDQKWGRAYLEATRRAAQGYVSGFGR